MAHPELLPRSSRPPVLRRGEAGLYGRMAAVPCCRGAPGWHRVKPGGTVEQRPPGPTTNMTTWTSTHETSKCLSEAGQGRVGGSAPARHNFCPKEWFHERWVGGPLPSGAFPGSTNLCSPLVSALSATPSCSPHPSQVQTQAYRETRVLPGQSSRLLFLSKDLGLTPPSSSPRPCQDPGHRRTSGTQEVVLLTNSPDDSYPCPLGSPPQEGSLPLPSPSTPRS